MAVLLSVSNLSKTYGARHGDGGVRAMQSVSFDVRRGDVFTLLGPSGCGKTTTLQCIAGLETPTSGTIVMDGEVVYCSQARVLIPANKRKLGMVFQSYAIWPHMTVFENVAFPLVHGSRPRPEHEVRQRVMQALDLVKLHDYADRPSPHLSGGQQQRVALARALVHEPRLLLLDEPLSNLDAKLRDAMRIELRQLVKNLGITTIFVTHDQVEAMSMSDQIVLMRAGRIEQMGSPRQIYLRPVSRFAADFMGRSNLIPGRAGSVPGRVETPLGPLHCDVPRSFTHPQSVYVVIRPQAIAVVQGLAKPNDRGNLLQARINRLHFLGDVVEAEVSVGNHDLRVMTDPYLDLAVGQQISLDLPPARCVVVAATGSEEEAQCSNATRVPVQADGPIMARAAE